MHPVHTPIVDETFGKLKTEFDECQIDATDKAIVVLHKNLKAALERKRTAVLRSLEASQLLSAEWISVRPALCLAARKANRESSTAIHPEKIVVADCSNAMNESSEICDEETKETEVAITRHKYCLSFNNRFASAEKQKNPTTFVQSLVQIDDRPSGLLALPQEKQSDKSKRVLRARSLYTSESDPPGSDSTNIANSKV